ncbi:MAG: hypothetical protein J6S83_05440 [Lachnospiraceae bacterium]|nr:hypothetical protein [Lachnospiraceae bacterium]
MTGTQRDAIEILKMMDSVTVNADLIAQALGMNPGVLRKHVKEGDYRISAVEVCGDRIRFFRKDFLQKIGEIPPDTPEVTDSARLDAIIHLLSLVLTELRKKTAGAATPTD